MTLLLGVGGHDLGVGGGLHRPVAPMLAVAGQVPVGAWAYEFKWDGVRAIVEPSGGRTRLTSRNLRDITNSYPEIAEANGALGGLRAVLDGEIVALDERGAPSFARLQHRMHVARPSSMLVVSTPVHLYLFDLLELDGHPLIGEPYTRRRELLDQLGLSGGLVYAPPSFTADRITGADMLVAARESGLEGVVAKRLTSTYRPGQRSQDWIKTALERSAEVIVCGWKPGAGRRLGMIGSVMLGAYDEQGRLVYVGHVGTGFTEAALRELAALLEPLAIDASPLDVPAPREHSRDARWIEPVLVAEVVYRTLTPDGRLRHPSWRGLRPDKAPDGVYWHEAPR
ncbi:ATP-dependent DNA ligase [Phytohabitans aurantiacus]|uniref:DNA ligase (ATP) n=2 Tax=Phytohabitans aurantiacus TaxID=3016789 RepID=A0ABQ5QU60_9ACTN|nr:ATP-dependent DNA ligase [Phytohabitans aurantiacus]